MPLIRLKPVSPFNFNLSLDFCRRSRFELLDHTQTGKLSRVIIVDNIPLLIEISSIGTTENPLVRVKWNNLEQGKISGGKVESIVRKIISSDLDLKPFYKIAKKEKRFSKLIARFNGLKPILTPTVFESAAWAIMGQQVNLSFAFTLKNRLVQRYGRRYNIDGQEYFTFPNPGNLWRVKIPSLRKMQFSQRKAEYLIGLAKIISGGEISLSQLKEIDCNEAVKKLTSIRGLGEWSANYILMRGAGHADCLPIGDSGLTRGVRMFYGLKNNPDSKKIYKLARKYRPYRSLFTLYLWFYLMEDINL